MGWSIRAGAGPALRTVTLALLCTLPSACSRNAPHETALGPDMIAPVAAKPADTSAASALRRTSGLQVASFQSNLASLRRMDGLFHDGHDGGGAPDPKVQPDPEAFPSQTASAAAMRGQAYARAKALQAPERGRAGGAGLGRVGCFGCPLYPIHPTHPVHKGPGGGGNGRPDPFNPDLSFEMDTSWFDYSDSAQGHIHWIRVFHDAEADLFGLVRDSLVYRWPYAPKAPVLTASHTRLVNFDGHITETGISDADGDGDLNRAAPGAGPRVRKEWVSTFGDTTWKSVRVLDRGHVSSPDSTGEGAMVSFTDSIFVKGKAVSWSRTFDGDGDGLVLEAAAGAPLVVRTESFTRQADGRGTFFSNAYGPGADGDWSAPDDNPLYPYTVIVLSAAGDTLSVNAFGDADGDGFYADPAHGAANRVWQTCRRPDRDGSPSRRDSVVRILNDLPDDGDDLIAYYGSDTAFHAEGSGLLSVSQGFAATAPMRAVDPPQAGTWVREERYAPAPGAAGVRRLWRKDVFDHARRTRSWDERRYLANGDSVLATGSRLEAGAVVYADFPDPRTRSSGWYDPGSERFRDTLALLGNGSSAPALEIREGIYKRADGTGDYALKAVMGNGNATVTRVIIARDGNLGLRVSFLGAGTVFGNGTLGGDAARRGAAESLYRLRGDSASWIAKTGDTTAAFLSVPLAGGGSRINQRVMDGSGVELAEGEFRFASDGSGAGSYRDKVGGAVRRPVEFVFGTDRAIRIDGVKVEQTAVFKPALASMP